MAPDDSPVTSRRSARAVARGVLRSLAASVYARIAFVVVVEAVEPSSSGMAHLMAMVVLFAASSLLSRIEGGTTLSGGLTGAFWALFELLFGLVLLSEPDEAGRFLVDAAPSLVDAVAVGLLGAHLSARLVRSDAA